jgi:aminoglycoside 6'-N-acetyltransferase I
VTKRSIGNRQKKIVAARNARGGERSVRVTAPRPPSPVRQPRPPAARDSIRVRAATPDDAPEWARMRVALWPDGSEQEHRTDVERFFAGRLRTLAAVLLASDSRSRTVGFAELSIRPYAEGCRTDRVAFLEGWYVDPEFRGRGVGRALVEAAEAWARTQGCSELASDREAENELAGDAHRAVGFEEVGTVVCYRKDL